MYIIDSTTVRVDSYNELSTILSANNDYTYIYLGVDIDMTSGIQINNSRTELTIDGEYPQGSGTFHTLRDSGGDSGMIYKSNISALDITLQNMTIAGRNYFGMPRIADGNTAVNLTYRNVTYTGPQITWHWSGLTRYIDCDITIMSAGYSAINEVAEICKVEIGGKTTIRHNYNGTTYAAFQFYHSGASFTILKDAEVEISTNNDFLFHSTFAYPPNFVIQPNASLTLTTQRGISRSVSHRFASFLVDTGATFRYIQISNAGDNAALYIDGPFTVNDGARVYMQADFTSSSSTRRLVQFTANSSPRGLYLNKPKSFVLYNRGPGTAIYFSGSTPFSFTTQQVNFWSTAGLFPTAGTFDDPPLYPWHNPDWSGFTVDGSATTNSTTASSTLTPPVSPPLTNLQLHVARVLSVGELPLEVDDILDDQTPINGKTDPYANIKVEYEDESGARTLSGTSDASGVFSVPVPAPIPLGTSVGVSANVPFLYITVSKTVQEAGELYIESAPDLIKFIAPSISASPTCIFGRAANDSVWVVDKRATPSAWELMASIDGPMRCTETGRILIGNVVFVPTGRPFDDEEPLEPAIYKRVFLGGPNIERTEVKWDKQVGILLHITGAIHLGDKYGATLLWQVRPIEP